MVSKPIAIPARLSPDDSADPRVAGANRLFRDVVALVRSTGLEPVVVTDPMISLDDFAGVVLPGGGDLHPALYGGAATEAVYDVNPAQDELDLMLARRALRLDLPVLGICRGAQVLNVAFGGTLFSDLAPTSVEHYAKTAPGEDLDFVWHAVSLNEDSALAAELGVSELSVASGHHQGIDRLGTGLRAAAVAADGLVEAFEDEVKLRIGVQWHPEATAAPEHERNAPFRIFARSIAREASNVCVID